MIYYGTKIQETADKLKPVEVSKVFKSITFPDSGVAAKIRQLKIIYQVDPKMYSKAKKTLPYFVCGNFNPAIRRTENFAFIEHFVIDIDDIAGNNLDIATLRAQLKSDNRTELLFVSPSDNGLKIMFKLKERCYDHGLFSTFYKEFARRLGNQYHLGGAIDTRTSDVCRACFISSDNNAYYNANPEPIDMNDYLNFDNPLQLFDLKHEHETYEKEQDESQKEMREADPADEAMNHIKEVLAQRREKQRAQSTIVYVPEELESLMEGLKAYVEDNGVELYDISNIQYGKKIKCRLGLMNAELNLFYGKKGFSVVVSPKHGTSTELNKVLAELIQGFIDDNT